MLMPFFNIRSILFESRVRRFMNRVIPEDDPLFICQLLELCVEFLVDHPVIIVISTFLKK